MWLMSQSTCINFGAIKNLKKILINIAHSCTNGGNESLLIDRDGQPCCSAFHYLAVPGLIVVFDGSCLAL